MYTKDIAHIGHVAEAFPSKEELIIHTSNKLLLSEGDPVFFELDGSPVPYFIHTIVGNKNGYRVSFDTLLKIKDFEQLKSVKVYVQHSLIEKHIDGIQHNLIGFVVIDNIHGNMGVVETIEQMPGQQMLIVTNGDKQLMIPLVDQIVYFIDLDNKTLKVNLPEGFIELN